MPVGSYGVIRCSWKEGGGHIWCWEIDKEEGLVFWDGQTGAKPPVRSCMGQAKRSSVLFARLDKATPTDGILDVVSIPEPERKK